MIGLVACSSQKLKHAAIARRLYSSPLFQKSIAYAERRCMQTFVISAAHGLVGVDDMIEPYDRRLGRKVERARWGRQVVAQLIARGVGKHEDLLVLAGEDYSGPIRAALRDEGWTGAAYEPLQGKQVGDRLAFLNAELDAMPPQLPAPKQNPVAHAIEAWATHRATPCGCTCEACCDCAIQREGYICNFCGKTDREVTRMISGPRAAICDGCIEFCVDIIDAQESA